MSNIHGLFSAKKKNERDEDEHDSGDDDGSDSDRHRQGFFVGGSERSGQQVLGPRGDANRDMGARLFEAARLAGAEQINPEEAEGSSSLSSGRSGAFHGTAYRLGGHGQGSEAVVPPANEREAEESRRPVVVTFNMWTNGFSIDDGPLRAIDDPANRPFIQAIGQGQLPRELVELYPGRKIDFHMHRRNTDYVPPKPLPFAGKGQRLGSVVPNVVDLTNSDSQVPPQASAEEAGRMLAEAQSQLNVQAEQPQTRLQIRVAGSSPIIGTFNHEHQISDLRNFIVGARPDLAYRPFQLATTYPPAVIENEAATLKEANILGSVINVKFV